VTGINDKTEFAKLDHRASIGVMEFEITQDHLKLLRKLYFNSTIEPGPGLLYGLAEVDPKRPYGDSDIEGSIAEILSWVDPKDPWAWGVLREADEHHDGPEPSRLEELSAKAKELHHQMPFVLQIVMATGEIRAGVYRKTDRYRSLGWERVPGESDKARERLTAWAIGRRDFLAAETVCTPEQFVIGVGTDGPTTTLADLLLVLGVD
jgi:hypothetical protein